MKIGGVLMRGHEAIKKSIRYILIMFGVIALSYLVLGHYVHMTTKYRHDYLSIYTSMHEAMFSGGLPMWSWDIFLGHNLLGLQSYYSMLNPFFLITLPFSATSIADMYLPYLFLKLLLAFFAFFIYMKQTKWFSMHTTIVCSILYLFNGWVLTNLSEFVTIELLLFIPLLLYGVERLLADDKKRYFVCALSLILLSHFSLTLIILPFLIAYILMRLTKSNRVVVLRQVGLSFLIVFLLTLMFVLPILLASDEVKLQLTGEVTFLSVVGLLAHWLFPPMTSLFNDEFVLFTHTASTLSIYQSLAVILLLPQFFVLVSKKIRYLMISFYAVLVGLFLFMPAMTFTSISNQPPITANHLSVLMIVANTMITAYVLSNMKRINLKLLKWTQITYLLAMLSMIGLVFGLELLQQPQSLDADFIYRELLSMTPFLFTWLILVLGMKHYHYILSEMKKTDSSVKYKLLIVFVLVECSLMSLYYFEANYQMSDKTSIDVYSEDYIVNQTYAVTDYIQTIDEEFYRIINGYAPQLNEPQYSRYPGFSIAQQSTKLQKQLPWLLDVRQDEGLMINQKDYFLTTALSAKYYLSPSFGISLPGYEYYDRIEEITVYRNEYFIPIGSRQTTYVLESDFNQATDEQKQFMFLNSLIVSESQVTSFLESSTTSDHSDVALPEPYDLSELPDEPKELDYYEAAQLRQRSGVTSVSQEGNKINCKVWLKQASLITFTIPYDEGWRVYANGEPLNTYQVNGGLMAVEFEKAGDYTVELVYTSPGYEIGFSITAMTALVTLGFLSRSRRSKKEVLMSV